MSPSYIFDRSLKDNQFYIGSSNNVQRRLKEHQAGKKISTVKRLPVELLYFEAHRSQEDVLRREKYFKTTRGKVTLRQVIKESLSGS